MKDGEVLDWDIQSGKLVETGLTWTGGISSYWKHIKNELILNEIVVPAVIQASIDGIIDGSYKVETQIPAEPSSDSYERFVHGLGKLGKDTGLYVVGPRGTVATSLKGARDYDAGHHVKKGVYWVGKPSGGKTPECPLLLS